MALDKIEVIKNAKKNQNIKAKQNYNNGKTNKQKHRADILPSWQKKLGQKSIYYVYSHTKISSCEIKAEFVLAGKIDIHINIIDRLAIHHFRNKNLETGAS